MARAIPLQIRSELASADAEVQRGIEFYRRGAARRAALLVEARDAGVGEVVLANRLGMKRERVSQIIAAERARLEPR